VYENHGTLDVIVGGMYGSESKGRVASQVGNLRRAQGATGVIGIRVAGPNAGHVVYNHFTGERWALRQIPVVAVTDPNALLVIAAGSEIDRDVLLGEIDGLEASGIPVRRRLLVHNEATMIDEVHKSQEAGLVGRIGSTGKGIGAARADRLLRLADRAVDDRAWFEEHRIKLSSMLNLAAGLNADGLAVIVEAAQGYGLGLHSGFYPYVTSSDCRAIDALAMAGVNPWQWRRSDFTIHVVIRPNPIRVAGNSGPMIGETTWEELGLPVEHTTVTQKVRRVGTWDPVLVQEAVAANGGGAFTNGARHGRVLLAMAMADHVMPGLAGANHWSQVPEEDQEQLVNWMIMVARQGGALVGNIGTGPDSAFWLAGDPEADEADAMLAAMRAWINSVGQPEPALTD
jgi:adenylosuccinate synthase